jgi:hypothetical protein
MKRVFMSALIIAMFICGVQVAQACECVQVGEKIPAKKWIADFKGAVFLGKVKSIVEVEVLIDASHFTLEREVTFEIEEIWKGVEGAELKIRTGIGGGDCGVRYVEGEMYFVVAHSLEGKLKTDICTSNTRLSDDAETIRELGKGKRPKKA